MPGLQDHFGDEHAAEEGEQNARNPVDDPKDVKVDPVPVTANEIRQRDPPQHTACHDG